VFTKAYSDFTRRQMEYRDLVNSTKKMIMLVGLGSEIYSLGCLLERIAERNRWYRDFTLNSITFAIREVIAALKVYRTYIYGPGSVAQRDRGYIDAAVAEAKKRNPRTAKALFDFVRDTLLLQNLNDFAQAERSDLVNWVMKFQQITGPVIAKGVEDTGFYVFNRLISLNEVGGDPERFGISLQTFHQQNSERARRWPHSMLASTTHDTKRSEDARARISVLSELPDEWSGALARWSAMNASKKVVVDGLPVPDPNEEYLLYQTLVGSWPLDYPAPGISLSAEELADFRRRITDYMQKAIKEAKVHTSWINPNVEYDDAVRDFVAKTLSIDESNPFLDDFRSFLRPIAYWGFLNSLAQLLLKLTSPGVPDTYQGSELWDLRLVDPDNRAPVDYQVRVRLLSGLKNRVARIAECRDRGQELLVSFVRELLASWIDGRVKMYVIQRTLNLRRKYPQLFSEGGYEPMQVRGDKAEHVCAYSRTIQSSGIIVAVPRLVARLTSTAAQPPLGAGVWRDSSLELPGSQLKWEYRNLFTGEDLSAGNRGHLPLAEVFANFPVALLEQITEA
jgi:(1->4)-alpha-D-glucan 1-alpha-D-glucosylmutase